MAPVSKKKVNRILKIHKELRNSGSLLAATNFRKSLKQQFNIDISKAQLEKILRGDPQHLKYLIRPKRFPRRHYYSSGVGLEGLCDIVYLHLQKSLKIDNSSKNIFLPS